MMIIIPMAVSADEEGTCGTNVTYTYEESTRTLTISGTGAMTDYDYFDSKRNVPWHSYRSEIVKAIIEDGVTSLGECAFMYCSELRSITIPNSVTSMGAYAFNSCENLESITIPQSVTSIGDCAFKNCGNLTSITIPNSVTSIGDCAFENCSSLTSITLSDSITSIGGWAFGFCTNLTSIKIPTNVTTIGYYAFYKCSGLTSITIPKNVTSIGVYAFARCSGLTSIHVDAENATYNSPNNCNAIIETSTTILIAGCNKTTIPDCVTSIGNGAFEECSDLTSITIPNNVTSIGEYAFKNCSGLTSIRIPNKVTTIGLEAFCGCSGLKSITIPNSVTSIGFRAFQNCSGLTSIQVGEGNKSYDSRNNCDAIIETKTNTLIKGCSNTTIPNSVTSIGNGAFDYCSGLTSITIPNSVTSIGEWAFSYCSCLTDIYCLAENVPNTGATAFYYSNIENVTLHVPMASLNDYLNAEPWKNFKEIVGLNDTTPETLKCETPTISYQSGELTFSSTTEGVEYIYEIADSDVKKGSSDKVTLTATYEISVYATKAGYDNSDIATATLCWIDATLQSENITTSMEQLPAHAVMIQSNGGTLNIQGAEDGTQINVYSVNGLQLGSAVSCNGQATLRTTLQRGSIAIVQIGQKSVKVEVK